MDRWQIGPCGPFWGLPAALWGRARWPDREEGEVDRCWLWDLGADRPALTRHLFGLLLPVLNGTGAPSCHSALSAVHAVCHRCTDEDMVRIWMLGCRQDTDIEDTVIYRP